MGRDLRLLPCEWWLEEHGILWGFSHTILDLGGVGADAWEAFQVLVKPHVAPMPVGHKLSSYVGVSIPEGPLKGESAYGTLREEDAQGDAYKAVAAQHLLPWLVEYFQYDGHLGKGPYQVAICAYVRALPAETKIILDWY